MLERDAIVLAALVGLTACGPRESAANGEDFEPRIIRVIGEAKEYVPADMFTFTIIMFAAKPTSQEALNEAAQRIVPVVGTLEALKPNAIRLIGPTFSVRQYYGLNRNDEGDVEEIEHPSKSEGFVATVSYRVQTDDIALVPDIISKVATLGVDGFENFNFGLRERGEVEKKAYGAAIADAAETAKAYAKSLGVKLGAVLRVDENFQQPANSFRSGDSEDIVVTARKREGPISIAQIKLPSEPPIQELGARVLVVYAID